MPELVNQKTAAPTRKISRGAVIGIPSGVIFVFLIEQIPGVSIPGEVAAAIGCVLSFIASYFVKERA